MLKYRMTFHGMEDSVTEYRDIIIEELRLKCSDIEVISSMRGCKGNVIDTVSFDVIMTRAHRNYLQENHWYTIPPSTVGVQEYFPNGNPSTTLAWNCRIGFTEKLI